MSVLVVSPSVFHHGSLFACSISLWALRARAAIEPEGLKKDSTSDSVTADRAGASVGRGGTIR